MTSAGTALTYKKPRRDIHVHIIILILLKNKTSKHPEISLTLDKNLSCISCCFMLIIITGASGSTCSVLCSILPSLLNLYHLGLELQLWSSVHGFLYAVAKAVDISLFLYSSSAISIEVGYYTIIMKSLLHFKETQLP